MKKETNKKVRFNMNSISFLKALKPKIRAKKQQSTRGNSNGARLLLNRLDKKLTGMTGTA